MRLSIPQNYFNDYRPPKLYLCDTGGRRIGELQTYNVSLTAKWNSYSELTFSIDRVYTDALTGETRVNPLFDKVEGLRIVEVENMCKAIIQDADISYADKDSKGVSAFSLEYGTGSKYLENFYINNGAEDSKEVIYEQSKYGYNATKDQMYKPANPSSYDVNEDYFHRVYTDANSYNYEQIQITDASAYAEHFGDDIAQEDILYIHGYANVQFYDPYTPELSLLHLIFEIIPEWSIGDVDYSLWHKERKFEQDRIAVYDFLMNDVHDTFKCVIEWDTLTGRVNFYEEADDGITEDNAVQTRFDTDVYVSRDNLASEINIKYSTDNIKTKLKVTGADNLDIREVNLGKNYLINLDYYHNTDWMDQDLIEAYDDYLDAVAENTPKYTAAMQNWVAAYNKWNDLMNAVPAEGNVVLVGDEFKKLYCIYGLYNSVNEFIEDTTYYIMNDDGSMSEANPQPNADNFTDKIYYIQGNYAAKESELIKKLTQYHVNEDIEANKQDNILLRLKNSANDAATIRIYNASTENTDEGKKNNPLYKIQTLIVRASTGIPEAPVIRDLSDWINGDLRVGNIGGDGMSFLSDFTINYIGIMGAYFVLAKDEREPETLEEYGVNLLKEKHGTYLTIFQTQTEAMYSQEDYQCIVQSENPGNSYSDGTRWLDTDSNPVQLYQYSKDTNSWSVINPEVSDVDKEKYENYQRYIDNYEKMVAVQEMLLQKEKEATYYLNGYLVPDRSISYKNGDSDDIFYSAADAHFRTANDASNSVIITKVAFTNDIIPLYTFTTTKAKGTFAVYLKGTTPYVSYSDSQGVYQAMMDAIAAATNFDSFFTREQWIALSPLIREDEYSDSNFLLTGYESEEERLRICQELYDAAAKELKTLSQPSLEFSMTMANILALPEFEPIKSQFALGNFIRIELRPGIIKRSRLLEVGLNLDDLSDFNTTFGNLITTKSEIDLHAELLAQAVQAGKQVAAAAGDWQSAVDKSNKLEESIMSGLQDAALQVGRASGQAITWDEHGLFARKFVDGSTDQYENEQMAIINNKIVFTNDGWRTSKAALGAFNADIDGDGVAESHYGLISDCVLSGYIEGSTIKGGQLEIGGDGGTFRVNSDGSVEILADTGEPAYANKTDVEILNEARKFHTEIHYSGSTVFSQPGRSMILTARVYSWDEDITDAVIAKGAKFSWIRSSQGDDATWNANNANRSINTITIQNSDIDNNAQFSVQVQFDDENL